MTKGFEKKFMITLIALILLIGLSIFAVRLENPAPQTADISAEPPQASEPTAPAPESAAESTEDTPYEPRSWTLSFAGDCTIGTLHEWRGNQSSKNMLYVIGEDYSYPFSNVSEWFSSDDFTMVNLEGTFTESIKPVRKSYRFSAPARYAAVLSCGSVEAVSLANNHSVDYGSTGKADTQSALEAVGVLWGDNDTPIITELDGGLKLGILPLNTVELILDVGDVDGYEALFRPVYEYCRDAGCDIVIAFVHWGWEYRTAPEAWMRELAHRMIDMGCDMVIGSHPHVLQSREEYCGAPIFYSLGNFAFGGHSNPEDKDSVVVRQEICSDAPGEFRLGETTVLPCCISSVTYRNDFCPTPYAADSEGYARCMEKLSN